LLHKLNALDEKRQNSVRNKDEMMDIEEHHSISEHENKSEEQNNHDFYSLDTLQQLFEIYLSFRSTVYSNINLKNE
jgi:hypothetical protein